MADDSGSEEFYWYDPPQRGQLSIEKLHIPARLQRRVLQEPYEIRVDTAFADVIKACAAAVDNRPQTWINDGIRDLFTELHKAGHAHSIECWQDNKLVGGLYGLAIGGFFSGESMFSRKKDASKIALVHLCARLWKGGFSLLDTQFINDHLLQFGAYEVPREDYLSKLQDAVARPARFQIPQLTEQELVSLYCKEKTKD